MSSELRLIRVMMKAGSFTGMWPPFFEKRRFCLWAWNVLWLLILTNFAFLLTFMLLSFYVDRPKIADSVEAITMMCILGQLIVNQVTWKLYEKRVRKCVHEILDFLYFATDDEEDVIRALRRKCSFAFKALVILAFISWGSAQKKLFLDDQLSFALNYPCSQNGSLIVTSLIKAQQMFSGALIAAGLNFDLLLCSYYLYPAIKLVALSKKFTGNGTVDLKQIVKEHQAILRFAQISRPPLRIALVKMNVVQAFISVFMGYFILETRDESQIAVFGTMFAIVMSKYFIYCWCSQQLINACELFFTKAYEADWLNMTESDKRMLLIIMMRAQRPMVVEIRGLIPPFSLEQFMAFANFTGSYIMTLRTLILENN